MRKSRCSPACKPEQSLLAIESRSWSYQPKLPESCLDLPEVACCGPANPPNFTITSLVVRSKPEGCWHLLQAGKTRDSSRGVAAQQQELSRSDG